MNETVNIAKAIGIILVVWGHCTQTAWVSDTVYSFHMPLFFIISGYLFKDKYFENPRLLLKRKAHTLLLPYVKWLLTFTLLHNALVWLHVYDSVLNPNADMYVYSVKEIAVRCLKVFTLHGTGEPMLGALWFLPSLFFGLFFFVGFKKCMGKYGLVSEILLALIGGYIYSIYPHFGINHISKYACIAVFIHIGYQLRPIVEAHDFSQFNIKSVGMVLMGLLMLVMVSHTIPTYIADVDPLKRMIHLFTGVIGTWFIWKLSSLSATYMGGVKFILNIIGSHTMQILIWHFCCFKIVSLLIIYLDGLPLTALACYPVIKTGNPLWTASYIIIGVFLPIFFHKIIYNNILQHEK